MKRTHAAQDYANRSHKVIETVFTKFNRATYFILISILIAILLLNMRQAVQ
jgi:hypothetical protein